MNKISLVLNGKILKTIELEEGREYIAGRADDCDFPLSVSRGISRQHLKFFQQDGIWCCESLSKFLHPQVGSENFETLEMTESVSFTLHPFEFRFIASEQQNSPSEQILAPQQNALVPSPSQAEEMEEQPASNMEATMVGSIQVTPMLRISYPDTSENETLKLEGQVWTAGRDSDAEIQLHNPKISRKHFELNRNQDGYFITDLGSSNGTYLNGQRLAPHEPTRLSSGDVLRTLDIEISFEIKAANLPVATAQPLSFSGQQWMVPAPWQQLPSEFEATVLNSKVFLEETPKGLIPKLKSFDWKKNKVRVALGALGLLFVFLFFSGPESPKGSTDAASSSSDHIPIFDNLSPEQKMAVKDSLSLARNLYVQGKYSLCLAEIAKLHETVPFYDNSKELESFCIQGHELTQRKLDNDRKEAEKAMVEQKILDVTSDCKEKFDTKGEVDEVRQCLAEAIELNPEHPLIVEQIQRAEDRIREKETLAQQRIERAQRINSTLVILSKANRLRDSGKLAKAKKEYAKFLDISSASLTSQRAEAKRELASVTSELSKKVGLLMDKCKAFGEANKLKDAYKACDEALKEDPSIKDAKELKEKYLAGLRREMKAIYEDARLEESLGNLETAKEKWKRIREEDLEFDSYHKNSTIKLRQYGAL